MSWKPEKNTSDCWAFIIPWHKVAKGSHMPAYAILDGMLRCFQKTFYSFYAQGETELRFIITAKGKPHIVSLYLPTFRHVFLETESIHVDKFLALLTIATYMETKSLGASLRMAADVVGVTNLAWKGDV